MGPTGVLAQVLWLAAKRGRVQTHGGYGMNFEVAMCAEQSGYLRHKEGESCVLEITDSGLAKLEELKKAGWLR
jgi:hypothetical protein